MHTRRSACRLCGGNSMTRVVDMKPIPVSEHYFEQRPATDAERYPIDIYQCAACGAAQTQDDLDPEFLWSQYTYYTGQTPSMVRHFEGVVADVERLFGPHSGKAVFDIGSNDGTLLDCFRKRGARVWGVDPAEPPVKVARAKGIKTYHRFFNESVVDTFDAEDRAADIVTAFNVFAHSPNMPGLCRGAARMLKPDGVFLFEAQYLGDIAKRKILGTFFHEHMVHYSAIAAENFLRLNGLKIFDYLKNDSQMGSVIFCATHESNTQRQKSPRFQALLDNEKKLGLDSIGWGAEFNAYIAENRKLALDFADRARAAGDKVCAYGGARSGPSLLIQFGIEPLVDVVFDDHKDKVGKYSRFRSLFVRPTAQLSAREYKYCIVTAYLYVEPILRTLDQYLADGGKVVALWPNFTIISSENREQFLQSLKAWLDGR